MLLGAERPLRCQVRGLTTRCNFHSFTFQFKSLIRDQIRYFCSSAFRFWHGTSGPRTDHTFYQLPRILTKTLNTTLRTFSKCYRKQFLSTNIFIPHAVFPWESNDVLLLLNTPTRCTGLYLHLTHVALFY